ncbi:MAG: hypothetical protein GX323_02435 [Clostridiales bacterium]|nr:hypothetical protein [Clostridiales bacterium]
MFFKNKVDRAFKWLEDKNRAMDGSRKDLNADIDVEEDINFEKKDYLAIIISAFLVFGPIFIVLLVIALWAFL